ncbi:MAG: arylsulfatase [Candidatus Hydrogenedentes bacterium]|nr:arylsulfatase [Candidatus Hydrogenedentota bacterium]
MQHQSRRAMRITRRGFLQASSLALAASSCARPARRARHARPNIVLVMVDDMGFSDIGCYGSEIHTPSLDKLAARGVRFTQAYSAARCCPTRASLLTGLYAHQAGIGHMTNEAERVFDYGHPSYLGELNRRCVTIAEVLRPAGYHTWMAGKWHVGTADGMRPLDRGFERYFGIVRGACNYFKPDPDKLLMEDRTPVQDVGDDFYTTDAFTGHALRFIDEQDDDAPFFLYLAYNAPHWPLNAWPEDIAKYRDAYHAGWDALRQARLERQRAMGLIDPRWALTERDEAVPEWEQVPAARREELAFRMAIYAAQIDRMDQNIGRLVAGLEQAGQLDNTLFLFLSDNGGCAEGNNWGGGPAEQLGTKEGYFLTYGRGWANASNTPFRRYKHWVHEGGISSPFIAHWPAGIPARYNGGYNRNPIHIIDLMATAADLGHAPYPEQYAGQRITPLEGRSFAPLLAGRDRPIHDALFWEHEGNRAVRRGSWKLVSAYARGTKQWELYDIDADRTETRDLAAQRPDTVAELAQLYEAWAERCSVLPWPAKEHAKHS